MLLGISGVIRGAPRNATVKASQAVELLMIPRETYLKYWHRTYTAAELRERLSGGTASLRSAPATRRD